MRQIFDFSAQAHRKRNRKETTTPARSAGSHTELSVHGTAEKVHACREDKPCTAACQSPNLMTTSPFQNSSNLSASSWNNLWKWRKAVALLACRLTFISSDCAADFQKSTRRPNSPDTIRASIRCSSLRAFTCRNAHFALPSKNNQQNKKLSSGTEMSVVAQLWMNSIF